MMMHAAVSVDIDRFSDRKLEKDWLPLFEKNGAASTVAELREHCRQMRAKGFEVFPNAVCDNHRPDGTCAGHSSIEEVRAVVGTRELTDEEKKVLEEHINVVCENRVCKCSGVTSECGCAWNGSLVNEPCMGCKAAPRVIWMDTGELVPTSHRHLSALALVKQIKEAVAKHHYNFSSEAELNAALHTVLSTVESATLRREVKLSPQSTIDYTITERSGLHVVVGVEIKVDGSYTNVARQLLRYARTGKLDALVLVTPLMRHWTHLPPTMNGVPVHFANVGRLR
jgi:hypothetical protein